MDLAQYIVQFCKRHKISKEEFAKKANISRSTLYRMLEDDSTPTLLNLTKLAIAMQVHPQYLVKLEWDRYHLAGCQAQPIDSLIEPKRWFEVNQDCSHFISETVPDGSIVCTNERFKKTWRIQNTGNTVWHNRRLKCQDHHSNLTQRAELHSGLNSLNFDLIPLQNEIKIPTVKPGETVDLTVEFQAPSVPACTSSYWKMIDEKDNFCFPDDIGVYINVQVISAGSAQHVYNDGNP